MIRSTSVPSPPLSMVSADEQGATKLMTVLLRPSAPTAEELEDEQEEKEWQKAKEKEAREKKHAARKAAREKAEADADAKAPDSKAK